jgi:hypothetical protein
MGDMFSATRMKLFLVSRHEVLCYGASMNLFSVKNKAKIDVGTIIENRMEKQAFIILKMEKSSYYRNDFVVMLYNITQDKLESIYLSMLRSKNYYFVVESE